jgi:hypothetical protein
MGSIGYFVAGFLLGLAVGYWLTIVVRGAWRASHRSGATAGAKLLERLPAVVLAFGSLLVASQILILFLFAASDRARLVINEPIDIGPDVLLVVVGAGVLVGIPLALRRRSRSPEERISLGRREQTGTEAD